MPARRRDDRELAWVERRFGLAALRFAGRAREADLPPFFCLGATSRLYLFR